MANINFDDGYEEFTINNDPNRIIRINPKDVNIINRFEEAMNELERESKKLPNIKIKADGTVVGENGINLEECTKAIQGFNEIINHKMAYIFNADVTHAAFGNQSPLSIVGKDNKFLFEVFMEAAFSEIKERIEKAVNEIEKRIEQYTGPYKGPEV